MEWKKIVEDVLDRAEITSLPRQCVYVSPYGKDKEGYTITRPQLNRLIKQGIIKLNKNLSERRDVYTSIHWPFKPPAHPMN